MTDTTAQNAGPMLAADGRPLKQSLNRALRRQKIRALLLIAPLLIFVLFTFIFPIGQMLFRSVENDIVSDTLPRTAAAMADFHPTAEEPLPPESVYEGLYFDMFVAVELKNHTRLGGRLNYENSGISSMFRKSGRGIEDIDAGIYTAQMIAAAPELGVVENWPIWMDERAIRNALPETALAWREFTRIAENNRNPDRILDKGPMDFVYLGLYHDYKNGNSAEGMPLVDVSSFETLNFKEAFAEVDKGWMDPGVWQTIKTYSPAFTNGYFLNSVDLRKGLDGPEIRPENERIYITLFIRTLIMSLAITGSCILLGYPVAWLLANLPMRSANALMILVLLPFWTSLLVRTSAWKVLLQQQGVINDILVWLGLVSNADRLVMINNVTGTIIAMTHILLPFMILPLYSVMKTIPPTYLRAAKSLGATNWTAFWRVYFPQSVPGIGAGSILVFILAIGYYITPEIVGGTKGVFISNRIAYHISSSLNWGLAAALGSILLVAVLTLYWVYDKIVGIDNVKLGG
jgi:putative spermidine/putrescine transport system permease protein